MSVLHLTLFIFIISSASWNNVSAYNILGFLSAPSLSHQITFQPIIKELARRGHNLTVITPNPIKDPSIKNLEEIDIQKISYDIWNKYNISSFGAKEEAKSTDLTPMIAAYIEIMDAQLSHPKVSDLINNSSKYHFDLFLVEFPLTFPAPLKRIYNCSMVGMTSMPIHLVGYKYTGNPAHPVLYPDLNLPFSNKLSFWEKVQSFLHYNLGMLFLQKYTPIFESITTKYFGQGFMEELPEIAKEFDLVLVNYNPILHVPRPNVPSVIEFNGVHIQPPKELPMELKSFMDKAKEGVVYISFGSNIKSSELPESKRQMILESLSELPYKFLWKFETTLANLPKNVRIVQWAPQQDILRHPNTKLFVTQGGLQSLDEAMYTKTPVLVIPFFGDQLGNAQKAVQARLGKSLKFASLTKETFQAAITEIINDDTYKLRMEEVHDILTDQPMSAVDKTVWWIEYALRHKGARHMRSPSVDATVIEYYMIDVIGFLLGIVLLALFFIYMTIKLMIKLVKKFFTAFFGRGDKEKKLKKN